MSATTPISSEAASNRRPPRRWLWALAAVWLLADGVLPPRFQPSTGVALAMIDAYQATLSKAFRAGGARCRFEPSCSHYGEAAIRARGAWIGGGLTAWRILRCGPWTPAGTLDPPPGASTPSSGGIVPPPDEVDLEAGDASSFAS